MPASWYSPEERPGMFHKPDKCRCTANLRQFKRGKKILTLCSVCDCLSDILLA